MLSYLNEMRRADSRAAAVGTQIDGQVRGFLQPAEGGGTGKRNLLRDEVKRSNKVPKVQGEVYDAVGTLDAGDTHM